MNKNISISNQVSATLNYLIAIHNIVLNETRKNKQLLAKFPAMPGIVDHLVEFDKFMISFADCWNEIIQYRKSSALHFDPISANRDWDRLSLLFKQSEAALVAKRKSIDFFMSWWSQPYIGGYLLLDHIGEHTMSYIFSQLKSYLEGQYEHYDVKCRLEIVYDELELFPELCLPNSIDYVIISKGQLPDFRFEDDELKRHPKKTNMLVDKLIAAISKNSR